MKETISVFNPDGSYQLVSLSPGVTASDVVSALAAKQGVSETAANHFALYCWVSGSLADNPTLFKLNPSDKPFRLQLRTVGPHGGNRVLSDKPKFLIQDSREVSDSTLQPRAQAVPHGSATPVPSRARRDVKPVVESPRPGDKFGYLLVPVEEASNPEENGGTSDSKQSGDIFTGWQPLWFALQSSRLWSCKSHCDHAGLKEIPLSHVSVVVPNAAQVGSATEFHLHTAQQVYRLRARTKEEMRLWVTMITEAINVCVENDAICLAEFIISDEVMAATTSKSRSHS